jgi:hypothetical protein
MISLGIARKILLTALKSRGTTKKPGFNVELSCQRDVRFYRYDAEWDTPSWAAAGHGSYAVNVVTGEVWDVLMCEPLPSPATAEWQRRVRDLLKLDHKQYGEAQQFRPCP